MAKVIIGGQMLSLVLALVVTPVFYALLDRMSNFLRRKGLRLSVQPPVARYESHAPSAAKEPAESMA
jgi:HAE1 family hydrophobic/amphiphilic exporter-1